MGLHKVHGLEESVGISNVPKVTVNKNTFSKLPVSWGRIVDAMFSVVRRCIIGDSKEARPQMGPRLFSTVLMYQQAMRAIWEAGGIMPQIVALCFDRSHDKEMKLLTTTIREARRMDAAAVACAAAGAEQCPNKDTVTNWVRPEDIAREITRAEAAFDSDCEVDNSAPDVVSTTPAVVVAAANANPYDVDTFMAGSLKVEEANVPVVPDSRGVVYQFLEKMYDHLTSAYDVPVPLLLSQGNAYIGPQLTTRATHLQETWGLLKLPVTPEAVADNATTTLFVCMCKRGKRASAAQSKGVFISVLTLVQTLCGCVDRILWGDGYAEWTGRALLKAVADSVLHDKWICEHTRDGLQAIMKHIETACETREMFQSFQANLVKDRSASCAYAIQLAERARVGEAEILVSRLRVLLTGSGDNASKRLGQTLVARLGPSTWRPSLQEKMIYTIESIDSDSKCLSAVNERATHRSTIRLVCSPKMAPGYEWWDSAAVSLSANLDVATALLTGLRHRGPFVRDVDDATMPALNQLERKIYDTYDFRLCVSLATTFWFAMPALLGQDCVPDWLWLMGASYKTLRQACAQLFWGLASRFATGHRCEVHSDIAVDLYRHMLSPIQTGLFDLDGSVTTIAFAAVCALSVSAVPEFVLATFDAIVNAAAIPKKRKRDSDEETEAEPVRKRRAMLGAVPLARCTHLLLRTVGSGGSSKTVKQRCSACERAVVLPVHHKYGTVLGGGPSGKMPDVLMKQMVQSTCTSTGRRGKNGNYMTGLPATVRGTVLRQVVVCAATLHQGYNAYVTCGAAAGVHSLDGSLTYPETLVASDEHRQQIRSIRAILAAAIEYRD